MIIIRNTSEWRNIKIYLIICFLTLIYNEFNIADNVYKLSIKNLAKKRQTAGSHKIAGSHQKINNPDFYKVQRVFIPKVAQDLKLKKAPKPKSLKI